MSVTTYWSFKTTPGTFYIRPRDDGRFQYFFEEQALESHHSPEDCAFALASGTGTWPSCGDPSESARNSSANSFNVAPRRSADMLFGFWRHCRFNPCQRARACEGDQSACLKRLVCGVPRDRQFQARQDLLEATPRHIGAPERAAREFMPNEFWSYHKTSGKLVDVTESPPRGWTRLSQRPGRKPKHKGGRGR